MPSPKLLLNNVLKDEDKKFRLACSSAGTVWNGSYSRKAMDLKSAYAAVKVDESAIRQYLKGKGIGDNEMVFSSVVINKEFDTRSDENGRHWVSNSVDTTLRKL